MGSSSLDLIQVDRAYRLSDFFSDKADEGLVLVLQIKLRPLLLALRDAVSVDFENRRHVLERNILENSVIEVEFKTPGAFVNFHFAKCCQTIIKSFKSNSADILDLLTYLDENKPQFIEDIVNGSLIL